MKDNKVFQDTINSLKKLIDNTENGIYDFDFECNIKGDIYYIHIIVKNASLYEMSYFLKELDYWKVMNNLKDYQILIDKSKGE